MLMIYLHTKFQMASCSMRYRYQMGLSTHHLLFTSTKIYVNKSCKFVDRPLPQSDLIS